MVFCRVVGETPHWIGPSEGNLGGGDGVCPTDIWGDGIKIEGTGCAKEREHARCVLRTERGQHG